MHPVCEFFFLAGLVSEGMGVLDYFNFRDETGGGGMWTAAASAARHVWAGLKGAGQILAFPFRKHGNTSLPGHDVGRTVSNALDSKSQFDSQAKMAGGIPVAVGFKNGKPVFENRTNYYDD
jgi:hypothetical protein